MIRGTLCLVVRGKELLLARKQSGPGQGRWNFFGGRIETGESPAACAVRELAEESGLVAEEMDIEQVAKLTCQFADMPAWELHVFRVKRWEGELTASAEMGLGQWFPIDDLPFSDMWPGDRRWLPLVLAGKKIQALISYRARDDHEVPDFAWVEDPSLA